MAEAGAGSATGIERVAILLMTLGEEEAAQVMQHMNPKQVQSIGTSMAQIENVTRVTAEQVLDEFLESLSNQTGLGIGADDYVRNVLNKALGEDKASNVIDRILLGGNSHGLEALKWMDAKAVAEMIRLEHPQIISIVLSYLDGEQAAQVLSAMPENMHADIVMRIASLDGIPPVAVRELDAILEKRFASDTNLKSTNVGGAKSAANILNFMDSSIESVIMEKVRESDAELGDTISDLMFVFQDLGDVDDRSIQTLLRDVTTDTLVFALKGADERLKQKILGNMSKRAAEMLMEDLEAKGPVKVSEVETAQKEILSVARQKEADGEITLGGSGGEELI